MGAESYGAMSGANNDNRVLITARVPPNAEIWVDDQKTTQTGGIRSFISPPLDGDHTFVYHLRARWTEDGRQVEKNRRYDVHAGDRLFVNFTNPRNEGMRGMSPGQSGDEFRQNSGDRSLERGDRSLEDRNRNRQENQDRTLDNRTDQHNTNPNTPRTGNDNRSGTSSSGTQPQGDAAKPPQEKP